jgi:Zn-dependent protease
MLGLTLPEILSRVVILIVAFTIHEFAHAYTAVQLGDDTPRQMGRLTLNPLAHLDPIGSLLLIIAGFGWAKPVPVNPYNLRNGPKMGMVLVAAAGPFSNFVMAALAAIPFRLGIVPDLGGGGSIVPSLQDFLVSFIYINLVLMLFNLIPIPPLDGSKILRGFAPHDWDNVLSQLERFGPILLLLVVYAGGPIMGLLVGRPAQAIFYALVGVS